MTCHPKKSAQSGFSNGLCFRGESDQLSLHEQKVKFLHLGSYKFKVKVLPGLGSYMKMMEKNPILNLFR